MPSELTKLSRPIVLAAGGTGGHILPAIAVGRLLAERFGESLIHYFCGDRPGELAIYRGVGIEPVSLPFSGHRRGLAGRIEFVRQFIASYRDARRRLTSLRPVLAVGFGGYLSAPVLVAARRLGAATAIHEQNALPGRANRWLARRADLILTGLETPPGAFPPERTRLVGNPVRAELLAPLDRRAARLKLGLPLEGPVCLCFGGSLGAAAINRLMLSILRSSSTASSTPPWHFLWAAGPTHLESVRAELAAGPKLAAVATVVGYLNDMASAYAAADLVIARAGALTLAELAALGKPSILIPLPTSAGGHQLGNARCMAEAGATILVEESDPSAAEKIATSLAQLGADWGKLSAMGKAASGLGKPDAARAMAEALAALVIARS